MPDRHIPLDQSDKKTEPRVCIFCGGLPLSREHVLPDWMRPYLDAGNRAGVHTTAKYRVSPTGQQLQEEVNHKHKSGDRRSQKLRVVCVKCNNEWMSQLQEDAKPFLLGPLTDRWKYLTREAQFKIAAWACMFTMVNERADLRTAAIRQDERDWLHRTKLPPGGWSVWVGRSDANFGVRLPIWHRGFEVFENPSNVEQSDAQFTIACLADLCIATLSFSASGSWPFVSATEMRAFGECAGFLQVWPPVEKSIFDDPEPPSKIDRAEAMKLVDSVSELIHALHHSATTGALRAS